ncbi:MAG: amidohydrolase family protein, partial [Smithellaceae bacterium]|nr:amidohydrolase family protein [Smithellaceae bacterium]
DLPQSENPATEEKVATARRFLEHWRNYSPLITPALFCHSAYSCAPETLSALKDVAREARVPYFLHVSETNDEIRTMEKRYGKRTVLHLEDCGVLDGNTVAVHCNWLDEEEMNLIGARDVKVSHNPESGMKLAAGVAPIPELITRGVEVGIGTDGCASNNDLDMFREMDQTAKIHKLAHLDPTCMDARQVLTLATSGGARVLGMEDIGSITPGKLADLILISMDGPHAVPIYDYYSHLVYCASRADVKTSIIGGRIVMKDRTILTFDLEETMARVRTLAATVKADLHTRKE